MAKKQRQLSPQQLAAQAAKNNRAAAAGRASDALRDAETDAFLAQNKTPVPKMGGGAVEDPKPKVVGKEKVKAPARAPVKRKTKAVQAAEATARLAESKAKGKAAVQAVADNQAALAAQAEVDRLAGVAGKRAAGAAKGRATKAANAAAKAAAAALPDSAKTQAFWVEWSGAIDNEGNINTAKGISSGSTMAEAQKAATQAIATELGVTVAEVKGLAASGKVAAQDVTQFATETLRKLPNATPGELMTAVKNSAGYEGLELAGASDLEKAMRNTNKGVRAEQIKGQENRFANKLAKQLEQMRPMQPALDAWGLKKYPGATPEIVAVRNQAVNGLRQSIAASVISTASKGGRAAELSAIKGLYGNFQSATDPKVQEEVLELLAPKATKFKPSDRVTKGGAQPEYVRKAPKEVTKFFTDTTGGKMNPAEANKLRFKMFVPADLQTRIVNIPGMAATDDAGKLLSKYYLEKWRFTTAEAQLTIKAFDKEFALAEESLKLGRLTPETFSERVKNLLTQPETGGVGYRAPLFMKQGLPQVADKMVTNQRGFRNPKIGKEKPGVQNTETRGAQTRGVAARDAAYAETVADLRKNGLTEEQIATRMDSMGLKPPAPVKTAKVSKLGAAEDADDVAKRNLASVRPTGQRPVSATGEVPAEAGAAEAPAAGARGAKARIAAAKAARAAAKAGAGAAAGAAAGAPVVPTPAVPVVGSKLGGLARGSMRFLGPLMAVLGAYEVAQLLKSGSIDRGQERKLKVLESLGVAESGFAQEMGVRSQMDQDRGATEMMAGMGARARQDQEGQLTNDMAMNQLIRSNQQMLQSLASPSRQSLSEVLAQL